MELRGIGSVGPWSGDGYGMAWHGSVWIGSDRYFRLIHCSRRFFLRVLQFDAGYFASYFRSMVNKSGIIGITQVG